MSSLARVLDELAAGRFPTADGPVSVLPQPSRRDAGIIAVTGHTIVFADVSADWVGSRLPADDLSAPLSPSFLTALSDRTGRRVGNIDVLMVAASRPGGPPLAMTPVDGAAHPRLARAHRYRDEVRAWQTDGGMVVLGRGVAGRTEVAVEVDAGQRGAGLGRRLALAARHLAPPDTPVWAQVAPGNAASVRAFLAAGYAPVGAEALLVAH